mmetsp:Transcript_19767/g.68079  ORF Transcript_19767/g.68079 Transcript_19767/m.68079 type:complete len:234 (+) Transcript_19767:299-1000(+)
MEVPLLRPPAAPAKQARPPRTAQGPPPQVRRRRNRSRGGALPSALQRRRVRGRSARRVRAGRGLFGFELGLWRRVCVGAHAGVLVVWRDRKTASGRRAARVRRIRVVVPVRRLRRSGDVPALARCRGGLRVWVPLRAPRRVAARSGAVQLSVGRKRGRPRQLPPEHGQALRHDGLRPRVRRAAPFRRGQARGAGPAELAAGRPRLALRRRLPLLRRLRKVRLHRLRPQHALRL